MLKNAHFHFISIVKLIHNLKGMNIIFISVNIRSYEIPFFLNSFLHYFKGILRKNILLISTYFSYLKRFSKAELVFDLINSIKDNISRFY